jgi:DnaJ like chaperone protein
MPTCIRCQQNIHPFSFRSYSKQSRRCSKCDAEIKDAVLAFIATFDEFAADGILTPDEWEKLKDNAARDGLDLNEALHYARPNVLQLIDYALELACQDEIITAEEEGHFNFMLQLLNVPDYYAADVRARLGEVRLVENIRRGILPVAHTDVYMLPGEICHFNEPATYINTETKTLPRRPGILWITNKKLMFSSAKTSGFDLEWRKVVAAVRESGMVYIQSSIKKGNGFLEVERPAMVEAIISWLISKAEEEPKTARQKTAPRQPPKAASSSTKSPYEVLQISPNAKRDEVAAAYRQMARLYHPDKVASLAPEFQELAELRMKEINAAYQTLMR